MSKLRWLAVVSAGAVILVALAVVSSFNVSALTKEEATVTFAATAPESDHVAALKACSHISPAIVPEPITSDDLPSDAVENVRFRVDHADDKELALLTECLNNQPGVVGWNIPDLTD